uniref:Uncharacterized protein n=1 Tax=Arundo donax TaxID=35708 RepID=A0A0A9G9L1_ARUDO
MDAAAPAMLAAAVVILGVVASLPVLLRLRSASAGGKETTRKAPASWFLRSTCHRADAQLAPALGSRVRPGVAAVPFRLSDGLPRRPLGQHVHLRQRRGDRQDPRVPRPDGPHEVADVRRHEHRHLLRGRDAVRRELATEFQQLVRGIWAVPVKLPSTTYSRCSA